MRKLFLLVALAMVGISVSAQSRQNAVITGPEEETEEITRATGWMYNTSTNMWVNNSNIISDDVSGESPLLRSYNPNFYSIRFVKYQGKYIMITDVEDGAYEYPSIYRGWYNYRIINGFLLSDDDYALLKEIVETADGKTHTIRPLGSTFLNTRYEENTERVFNGRLAKLKRESYFTDIFRINAQVVDGVKVVRFTLPDTKYSILHSSYSKNQKLEKAYFEVTAEEFLKLLTLT